MKKLITVSLMALTLAFNTQAQNNPEKTEMSLEIAEGLAKLALHCIHTEYPNKLGHVIVDSSQVRAPKDLHPSFYGCFDWHSSVHGHWMLVKVLKNYPNSKMANEIRDRINQNINPENIQAEIDYFNGALHGSYERAYGWAWLWQLQSELLTWNDADAKRWSQSLEPLVQLLRNKMIEYLPKLTYPIRTGVHPNTAFALGFAYDYAIVAKDDLFALTIEKRSREYFSGDKNYPAYLEPDGTDFFSPSLLEADLMSRFLKGKDFDKWFKNFMPKIPENLMTPAIVSDRNDLSIVHLDGLNLSRTWCMKRIAMALPEKSKNRKLLLKSAEDHLKDGLKAVASGDYAGEHWLASFAIYALSL